MPRQDPGPFATQIADLLRGKRKPEYTPHVDTGDFVMVVNAEKIGVTGNKLEDEDATAAIAAIPAACAPARSPRCSSAARKRSSAAPSRGCSPATGSARQQLRKLKVYAGPDHPHVAQKPDPMETR